MIKQVIVVRTSYPHEGGTKKLRRGKEIAQSCHASTAFLTNKIRRIFSPEAIEEALEQLNFNKDKKEIFLDGYFAAINQMRISSEELEWIQGIFTKICVKVDTEEELLELEKKAKEKGLKCNLITDRGLTEFNGVPTKTCLAIGPDLAEKIDEITGGLTLY